MNDILIARLESQSEKVRAQAVYRLANSKAEQSTQALVKALFDSSPRVRRQAAYALSRICPLTALSSLIRATQDSDVETCRRVALTLGKIGHPEAITPLINLLSRDNTELQYAAQKALIKIGKPTVPALIALYENPDAHIRALAVQSLGRIGDTQAIDIFVRALSDSDKWIRWMTASIVRSIPDKRFIEPLTARLDDEFMRWNAAHALGYVGDDKTIEVLKAIANDPNRDDSLRSTAGYAIRHIRERQRANL
jgi:HEAT repeat protein